MDLSPRTGHCKVLSRLKEGRMHIFEVAKGAIRHLGSITGMSVAEHGSYTKPPTVEKGLESVVPPHGRSLANIKRDTCAEDKSTRVWSQDAKMF